MPTCISSFLNLVQGTINLIFIGHLNNATKLAGLGIATMFINMAGIAPSLGLNTALETLVSQAIGSQNLDLCLVYL